MTELLLVAKATAITAAALIAVHLGRQASAASRALLLTAALAMLLMLPIAAFLLPPLVLDMAPVLTTAAVQGVPALQTHADRPRLTAPAESSRGSAGNSREVTSSRPLASTITALGMARAIWLIGAVVLGIRLAVGMRTLRRFRGDARPWRGGAAAVQQLLQRRLARRVEIVLHPDLAAPVTYGLFRPVVALPVGAPEWPDTDLRRALIHELEHVRRADWATQLLSRVVCAVYWFHPLVWIAARRVRLELEQACDDAVVRRDEGAAYAQQLVGLARQLSLHPAPEPLGMAGCRSLSQRVVAVLDGSRRRGTVSFTAAALALSAAVALAAAIAPVVTGAAQRGTREREALAVPTSLVGRSFDSVTIRPGTEGGSGGRRVFEFDPDGGRFTAHGQTLRSLIAFAYSPIPTEDTLSNWPLSELPDWQLRGGPEWFDTERFTIDARAQQSIAPAELAVMVRRLLADKFALAVHVEQHDSPAYRLRRVDANGSLGPRLRPALESCAARDAREAGGPGQLELRCINLSAYAAAYHLMEVLGRPVVDRTGLTGSFDLSVAYAPTEDELSVIYELQRTDLPPEMLSRPSIFTAFEQELGLKLEPVDAVVDTLVVDDARRPDDGQ